MHNYVLLAASIVTIFRINSRRSMYLMLYIFRAGALHITFLLPIVEHNIFLILHVSAICCSHHQGDILHRHEQRVVNRLMVICTLTLCTAVPIKF
jgi:hypothetical protein